MEMSRGRERSEGSKTPHTKRIILPTLQKLWKFYINNPEYNQIFEPLYMAHTLLDLTHIYIRVKADKGCIELTKIKH